MPGKKAVLNNRCELLKKQILFKHASYGSNLSRIFSFSNRVKTAFFPNYSLGGLPLHEALTDPELGWPSSSQLPDDLHLQTQSTPFLQHLLCTEQPLDTAHAPDSSPPPALWGLAWHCSFSCPRKGRALCPYPTTSHSPESHGIIEQCGLGETSRDHPVPPPATDTDTFH